jgi:CHAT domain-containing protein
MIRRAVVVLDGWAGAILQSGASGFIGGLWPLSDSGAADFSRLFYSDLRDALAQKLPALVAELLRKARRRFLETGDPTFMAYAFYGDTRLRIVGSSVR